MFQKPIYMKIFTKILVTFIFIFSLFISSNLYAQTVVQWYTSMGNFRAQLREDLVPVTAQNFIDLSNAEFYDGLIFHRVIADFMIQDGCPNGNGTGGPGYTFDDEFHPDLRHDQPGILSMANAGPNTNGSQYFITVVPTDWLDDAHAVFGKIMDGMEVVYAISEVETNANDRPLVDVVIDSIRLVTGDPSIELTAPIASGKWNNAIAYDITWNSAFIADVKIEFSSDNAQSWEVITDSHSAHYRFLEWELPNIISDECFIRISDVANPDVMSMNEEAFTICNLDLEAPNGFELFMNEIPVTVSWTSDLVGNLNIYYMPEENGDWVTIAENIPSTDESYTWLPDEATDWCIIGLEESGNPEVYDMSEFRFFVYALDILAPMGGEDLEGNTEFLIDWDAEVLPNIKIEFSADNGASWEVIASNVDADDAPYNWIVPNINASECFIKLSAQQAPNLYKMNTSAFSIHQAIGIDELNQSYRFSIQPNPVNDIAKIELFIPKKSNMIIEIFDLTGKMVYKADYGYLQGKQNMELDVSNLDAGVYLISVFSGEERMNQNLIVE